MRLGPLFRDQLIPHGHWEDDVRLVVPMYVTEFPSTYPEFGSSESMWMGLNARPNRDLAGDGLHCVVHPLLHWAPFNMRVQVFFRFEGEKFEARSREEKNERRRGIEQSSLQLAWVGD